jgi:hypothetical protein
VGRTARTCGRVRGGDVIQATRPSRARLSRSLLALALLIALAVYPAAATNRQPYVVIGIGGAAVAFALLGIALRQWFVVACAPALFGAEYATYLRLRPDAADVRAPLVAAALVVASELAFGAIAPEGGRLDRGLVLREAATLVAIGLGAGLLAGFLLLVSGATTSGVLLEAFGAVAAVGVVTVLVRAAAS